MAKLGRTWVVAPWVLLHGLFMVLVWRPWSWNLVREDSGSVSAHDDKFFRLLNLSSSLSFPRNCEPFLLEGAASVNDLRRMYYRGPGEVIARSEKMSIQGWAGGEWSHPRESSGSGLSQKTFGSESVGDHEASFSVNHTSQDGLGWSSKLKRKPPIQSVEGRLVLRNFWDWIFAMESAMAQAPEIVDLDQMLTLQSLQVLMKGAFVNTVAGSRVCMTGCAYRIDNSFQIDCGFVLKMTYTNHLNKLSSASIEAELSSSRSRADQLSFPAFRIVVPSFKANSEQTLSQHSPNLPVDLASYLAYYYDDTYSGYH